MGLEEQDFPAFIRKVKESTGIDLGQYKETQMKRRLNTLREKHGFATFTAFHQGIARNPDLLREFLDKMTINVSEFWRNANRWKQLEQIFLKEMLKPGRRLKCWSAACSTGEEPYTLAMILAELGALDQAQLHATDIDAAALERAKAGVYPDRSLREVPERYLRSYFRRTDQGYEIAGELKRKVSFRQGNLLTDRFEQDYDLIVCRNVIIYFTEEAKTELFHKFSRALRPGGLLFIGSTEQIFWPAKYGLELADAFLYRRIPEV